MRFKLWIAFTRLVELFSSTWLVAITLNLLPLNIRYFWQKSSVWHVIARWLKCQKKVRSRCAEKVMSCLHQSSQTFLKNLNSCRCSLSPVSERSVSQTNDTTSWYANAEWMEYLERVYFWRAFEVINRPHASSRDFQFNLICCERSSIYF